MQGSNEEVLQITTNLVKRMLMNANAEREFVLQMKGTVSIFV